MSVARDGFYLSTYLGPTWVGRRLGLRSRHDQNITLWEVGRGEARIVRHWQLERRSGIKHDDEPLADVITMRRLIDALLGEVGRSWNDVRAVWGTPELSSGHGLRLPDGRFTTHSFAHLSTALVGDSSRQSDDPILAFAVDGGPDHMLGRTRHQYVGAASSNRSIAYFPVGSPARLFDSARRLTGYEPGSLMALASATDAAIVLDLPALTSGRTFHVFEAGGMDLFADAAWIVGELWSSAERQIGPAEIERSPFSLDELRTSAVGKAIQAIAMQVMEANVEQAIAEFGVDPARTVLGIAGGFALNCPTNSGLMERYGFSDFWAPPCADDSGQAVGVGLIGLGLLEGRAPRFKLSGADLGAPVSDLASALERFAARIRSVNSGLDRFVGDLERGPVGWVEGRSEIGPRALGHRSLLCDPRRLESRNQVNVIKRREWWRPVAPVVLDERMADWFDGPSRSPYMLRTFVARPAARKLLPAVIHLDGTARCQTLGDDGPPLLRDAIRRFESRTGVGVLGNSSLNDRHEPIVESAADAIGFCLRRGVAVCYVDGLRIELDAGASDKHPAPMRADFARARADGADLPSASSLTRAELYFLATRPDLQQELDGRSDEVARRAISEAAQAHFADRPADREWIDSFIDRAGKSGGAATSG